MPSRLRNPPDFSAFGADFARPSGASGRCDERVIAARCADEAFLDRELERLESSVQWLRRERLMVALETGQRAQNHNRRLPRASQLPPVPGIVPVNIGPVNIGPVNIERATTGQRRVAPTFELAPPRARDRFQLPARRREPKYKLRGALGILIAGAVAGSIAYRISAGGLPSASQPAQAAPLQVP